MCTLPSGCPMHQTGHGPCACQSHTQLSNFMYLLVCSTLLPAIPSPLSLSSPPLLTPSQGPRVTISEISPSTTEGGNIVLECLLNDGTPAANATWLFGDQPVAQLGFSNVQQVGEGLGRGWGLCQLVGEGLGRGWGLC